MYHKEIEKIMEEGLMNEFISALEDALVNSIYNLDPNKVDDFFSDDPDVVRESILLMDSKTFIKDFMEDNNI